MSSNLKKILLSLNKKVSAISSNFGDTIIRNPTVIDTLYQDLGSSIVIDNSSKENIIFGPVPSRRLGYSLGVNNVRYKTCSYNCVYCQVGRTTHCTLKRTAFLDPDKIFTLVKDKIDLLNKQHVKIDYISIVSNGEPTLDINLAKEITSLRSLGHKIAVFTNSSLIWNDDVKESLSPADYVSIKIDSVNEKTWKRIDRPHGKLELDKILNGIIDFSKSYQGCLTTETMLVRKMNDNIEEIKAIGDFVKNLNRKKSYFAVPIRPPAEQHAVVPETHIIKSLSDYITTKITHSEMLCESEENDFKGSDNIEDELLGIISVHPMTKEKIEKFIESKAGNREILNNMIDDKSVEQYLYNGKTFYRRTHTK